MTNGGRNRQSTGTVETAARTAKFIKLPILSPYESFFCLRLFFFDEHLWARLSGLLAIKASFQR
jgi:hypothetical protein